MKEFKGYMHGLGIGGWLTNYKRMGQLPLEFTTKITMGDEEHFEKYITKSDVENIKSFGADHIRLGFDQMVIEEYDQPYVYRENGLKHIDNFVRWCEECNINLILNLHKAIGAYCDTTTPEKLWEDEKLISRFIALWEMIEERYSNKDIVFEVLNEIPTDDYKAWNILCERIVNALRKKNNNRKIMLGSAFWNNADFLPEMITFDDKNIVYAFHMYNPVPFTHQRGVLMPQQHYQNRDIEYPSDIEKYREFEELLGNKDNWTKNYTKMDINYLKDKLQGLDKFIKLHPDKIVVCSEFGVIRHCDKTSKENYLRDLISLYKERGIGYTLWNYLSTPYDGNRFSLVTDDERKIYSNTIKKMIGGKI